MDKLQAAAKAIAGALAGAVGAVIFNTTTEADGSFDPTSLNVELPNTQAEWIAFAIATALGFALPFLKRNYPSVAAAAEQLRLAEERKALGKQSK